MGRRHSERGLQGGGVRWVSTGPLQNTPGGSGLGTGPGPGMSPREGLSEWGRYGALGPPHLLPDVLHLLLQQLVPLAQGLVLLQQRLANPSSQL